MFYLRLLNKIIRNFWFESFLLFFMSMVFFLSIFHGDKLQRFTNDLWPEYRTDPYFTLVVERNLKENESIRLKKNIIGIKEIVLFDREALRLKLYNKFKKEGIDFPDELLDQEISQMKIFLNNKLDASMYQLVQEKIKSYFFDSNVEMSEIRILRKSVEISSEVQFMRRWGKEILIITMFLLWSLVISFFYWRTYSIVSLYKRFQYKQNVLEYFYLSVLSLILILTISVSYFLFGNLNYSGILVTVGVILIAVGFFKISNHIRE
jgi:hypothetical protein